MGVVHVSHIHAPACGRRENTDRRGIIGRPEVAEKGLICRRHAEMRGYTTSTVLWFKQRMFAGLRMTIGLYVKRTSLCSIAQVRRCVHSRGFDTSQVGSLG